MFYKSASKTGFHQLSITTALFTGLEVADACVYVAVAYDCVSATGYEVLAVGYVAEGLLIATTTKNVTITI